MATDEGFQLSEDSNLFFPRGGELIGAVCVIVKMLAVGGLLLEKPDWRLPENIKLKDKGDRIFRENKYLGIKARSAVLPSQFNYILNPRFPGYHDYLKAVKVELLEVDKRLG